MWLLPVQRLIGKLGHLPAIAHRMEFGAQHLGAQRGAFLGNDDILAADSVEKLDWSPTVKTGIHAETDSASSHGLRGLGQTGFEERDQTGTRSCIAWPQHTMPKLLQMSFETKQRMIRTPATLLGIVSNCGFLGLAINCNHN